MHKTQCCKLTINLYRLPTIKMPQPIYMRVCHTFV